VKVIGDAGVASSGDRHAERDPALCARRP
jgi:hypothetical protein